MTELVNELATLSAHISAGMCRWLELVGEFDRRGEWTAWGHGSCAEWLGWRCALTPRSAREHVRVARALPALPLVRAAFSRGELSYAKVRALTRVAEPRKEAELLELAKVMTASQLERALGAYRRVTTEDARDLHEREHLEWYWDEDGSLVVHGRLAPEDGALFVKSLEAARERLWQVGRDEGGGSAEPPPERPTRVDALVAVADAALAHSTDRTGGDRYQVVVHVDQATLGTDHEGNCNVAEGPALAPETARRLACDSSRVVLAERAGIPLNLGRKTRTIPPALRRALTTRDRCCRFPGCDNHRFLDAHHIHHWAHGGQTTPDNLLLLCRRHHRVVHEGGCTVDRQMRFYDQRGSPIPTVPVQVPGDLAALQVANRKLNITPGTCTSGHGDRMDLGLAVDALLGIIRRPKSPDPDCRGEGRASGLTGSGATARAPEAPVRRLGRPSNRRAPFG